MKRIKCPKCELNYMFEGQEMCEVCLKEKPRNIYIIEQIRLIVWKIIIKQWRVLEVVRALGFLINT